MIVQASEVFEDVLEGVRDRLLEGAIAPPGCVPEGTEQGAMLFGILGHDFLPAGVSTTSESQSPMTDLGSCAAPITNAPRRRSEIRIDPR